MVKTSRHALAVAMGLLLGSTAALAETEKSDKESWDV